MEDKQLICDLLLKAYQATRQFADLQELKFKTVGHREIVVAVFRGGGTRCINVTMDSGWKMIQDIANKIDG